MIITSVAGVKLMTSGALPGASVCRCSALILGAVIQLPWTVSVTAHRYRAAAKIR